MFRGLIAGMRLRPSGGLSYTRVRELVLEMLSGVGLEKSKYGLHSLRAGGARAAANAGDGSRGTGAGRVKMQRMGMLKDTVKDRLRVTQNLGL